MALSRLRWTVVPAVLLFTACTDVGGPDPAPSKLEALPRQLTAAEQKLIAGNNQFAFDLFRTLNADQHTKNVFVSPVSASMALGMTMNGANGETFDAMRHALRLDNATREEVNEGYKSLIALLRGLDKTTDFRIANSIWYEKTFPFSSSFLSESQSYFDASVKPLDFNNTTSSLSQINGWVNTATNKKIPQILDTIDPDEVMFLINAIYFKGSWARRFDPRQTREGPFTLRDGRRKRAMLMSQSGSYRYYAGDGFQAVALPYGGQRFSMYVFLPDERSGIDGFLKTLDARSWGMWMARFREMDGQIVLPRFTIAYFAQLNAALVSLGMAVAFGAQADFSKISDGDFLISEVRHKTFVEVN